MHQPAFVTALAAALAVLPSAQAGMYAKSSPVLQVNAKNFDNLIAKSNYTSVRGRSLRYVHRDRLG
jgi:protein disulfide-isomerase A6